MIEQVIEAIHARAMTARIEEIRTIVDALNERSAQLAVGEAQWRRRLTSRRWLMIRAESMRFFQRSGGTATQFDQLWPAVCHEALASVDPARARE